MSCAIALYCATLFWTADPAALDTIAKQQEPTGRGPAIEAVALQRPQLVQPDTGVRRKAVVLSEWYSRRLTLHRYGSYVILPLFAGEYVLGAKLLKQKDGIYDGTRRVPIDAGLRNTHRNVAIGLGAVFAANTVTGLWNLWDARGDGSSSTRRTVHVLSMLAADAGFAAVGALGKNATQHRPSDARTHRNLAFASMGVAAGSIALMWF